jgi:hypothetical protein
MQPTGRLGAHSHQIVVAVDQHPDHGGVVLHPHRPQPAVPQPGDGGGQRIVGSFLDALVEPSSRTLAASVGGTSIDVLTRLQEPLGQQLAQPPADSTAPVRSEPSGSAQANSRRVWHRSATSRNRASGRSSRSIATAVCVDVCGSTPMITVTDVPPHGRVGTSRPTPLMRVLLALFRATP